MKMLLLWFLFWSGTGHAAPSRIYARCFDEEYSHTTNLDGVIQIYDPIAESNWYNAGAKLKFNDSTYPVSGFVRYDGDSEFKTFRFFGSYLYQDGRLNGFKYMLSGSYFVAEISFGVYPQFSSRTIKLRCNFDSKPFPDYRETH